MNLLAVDSVIAPSFIAWQIAAVAAFWLAPRSLRPEALALVTFVFLLLADPLSLAILVGMTGVTAAATTGGRQDSGRTTAAAAAVISLLLVAFKLGAWSERADDAVLALLPIGISFYTFRCLHVIIETHLGIQRPHTPRELIGYLFFMPTIIAGPIHRFPDYLRDRDRQARLSEQDVSRALLRILQGYVKIVVLANFLLGVRIAPWAESVLADVPSLAQYVQCLHTGFHVYLFFAGYSDIAIGFALLMGFRVIENFNNPFIRTSISGFWRSWHISLSSWIREYVFAGIVALTRRRWLGVVASMVTIGLWHQLTVNWLLWGLYHACGLLIRNAWLKNFPTERFITNPWQARLYDLFGWFVTFNFVVLSFAIAKEATVGDTLQAFRVLLLWWL